MDKLAPPLSLDNLPAVYYPGSAHAISLLDDDIISLFPHYHGPIRVRTKYVLCLKILPGNIIPTQNLLLEKQKPLCNLGCYLP